MDPYDSRTSIDEVLAQEKKWYDAINTASVTMKDKDPVSASCVVWVISNGYVPRINDHESQGGIFKLPATWDRGDFYQETKHWETLGLYGYNNRHTYCSLRGDDLEYDLPSWEATTQLLRLTRKPKTLGRILELMFKITTEWFDMTRFPSKDGGPWDKAIRMQALAVALQQRYIRGKDAFELVLESSKKAIPSGVGALREQEVVMANYLDLFERATFAPEGWAHDKHLKAWIENMQKTGSSEFFPNLATASNVNEGTRILLRERAQQRTPLKFAAVWDAVRDGYLMSCGTGSENVDQCSAPAAERKFKARPGLDGSSEAAFLQPKRAGTKRP